MPTTTTRTTTTATGAHSFVSNNTRKSCYRKDDRAMCPIYGCPENFRDSLITPTATFPKIISWAFVSSDPTNVRKNLKYSFTCSWDNRGYPTISGNPWLCPHSPMMSYRPSTQTIPLCALVFPQFSIEVLGEGCEPPNQAEYGSSLNVVISVCSTSG